MVTVAGEALLTQLSPESRAVLRSLGKRHDYEDGALIHSRGDTGHGMKIVIKGAVRLCLTKPDGGHTFISNILPGQHFGDVVMFRGGVRTHDAYAIGRTVIDHYDKAAFDKLLAHPELVSALYRITALRLDGAMAMNDDLRGLAREVHLAKVLLSQWRSNGRKTEIACLQEDLAGMLGISNMTLSKCLGKLRDLGFVETRYRAILLRDPVAMRAWLQSHS
ncbi:MAG TPA: Crp/Fnr family transcriptional regulator [Novosphingobium sp.]|nr:Crp/Fnr family transcriptional regulator [Novosphingobium sp.]